MGYVTDEHQKAVTFDVDNSYPTLPFKDRRIVNLDFVYKQLLDGCKACKNTFRLDIMSKRKINRSCKHFIPQLPERSIVYLPLFYPKLSISNHATLGPSMPILRMVTQLM